MARLLTGLCARRPRALLVAAAGATVALGAYAIGVPDRLALGGGQLSDSESERTEAALAQELGYEPEPSFLLLLRSESPLSAAGSAIAVETLSTRIEALDDVGAITEAERSPDFAAVMLAVHLSVDAGPEATAGLAGALREQLDPGPYELLLAGAVPTQDGARRAALDDAPKLLALGAPLLILLLVGSLGLQAGLAALLAAALAAAGSLAALGLLGELLTIQAPAAIAAAFLAAVLAVQSGAVLLIRYRDEAATLGGGPEVLEYTLHTVLRGTLVAVLSAVLVGVMLFAIPIDFVRSIGIAIVIASLLGPALGILSAAALIGLRAGEEVGTPLPLVPDDARVEHAPRSFRWLLALGRVRRRGLLAVLPLLLAGALVLPVLDSEAIGLAPAELPAGQEAAVAGAEISGSFGPGAMGPLQVLTEGSGEAPTVTIYRDAIAGLGEISEVGRAETIGPFAAFDATPVAGPQSLAGQRAASDVRSLASPSPGQVGGRPAELVDSSSRLGAELPLLAGVALLTLALLWTAVFRSAFGPLVVLSAVLAPLAGVAAMVVVFGDGRLTGLLDYSVAGAPHLQSFAIVGAVLLALAVARGADFAAALRDERVLGGGAAGSLARSGVLMLTPTTAATLTGLVLAGVWLGSDLLPAKEIAVGLTAGLIADQLLARTLLAPALARLGL